ncbi:uncharacterized protein [Coffea arabica]|uniref:Uncharacterized protein isoform X2 n=1 Tax=Coffea arabica TaxID=13443 RepID=A0ABM4UVK0_COFAR
MAYVDHAFSISDEDIMMDTPYTVNNRPPIKEIALAVALLVFGTLGIVLGVIMAVNKVGGDRAHGKELNASHCPYETAAYGPGYGCGIGIIDA